MSAVRVQLAAPSSELVVSAASAWEVGVKIRAGTLPGGEVLLSVWEENLVNIRAGTLPWPHRNPFDRMLVAQAARRGLMLASSDPAVLAGAMSATLDTRR